MIRYEDFEPGRLMGSRDFLLDEAAIDAWCRLFPDDAMPGVMPHGMAAVVAMRAYLDIVQPRPPGNVHASQRYEIARLPRSGETLTTSVTCVAKEIRRDRRRVTLVTETGGAGGPAFRGQMTMVWAA